MALAVIAGAVGLRDQGVEAEQQAHSEDGKRHVDRRADAHGANGGGAERRHHDGVDDAHAHPTQFGQDDRHGQAKHGAKFRSDRCAHAPDSRPSVPPSSSRPGRCAWRSRVRPARPVTTAQL